MNASNENEQLRRTLRLCLGFLESAAFLNRQAFETCAWETLRDAAKLRAEGVRDALSIAAPCAHVSPEFAAAFGLDRLAQVAPHLVKIDLPNSKGEA
jgi:hypothetical protein